MTTHIRAIVNTATGTGSTISNLTTNTILGRTSAGTGPVEILTRASARDVIARTVTVNTTFDLSGTRDVAGTALATSLHSTGIVSLPADKQITVNHVDPVVSMLGTAGHGATFMAYGYGPYIPYSGPNDNFYGFIGAIRAGLFGTSPTSFTIGTGSKSFAVLTGLPFTVGHRVRISSVASAPSWSDYMEGAITGYAAGMLDVDVDATGGSGTHSDWYISNAQGGSVNSGTGKGQYGRFAAYPGYDGVGFGIVGACESVSTMSACGLAELAYSGASGTFSVGVWIQGDNDHAWQNAILIDASSKWSNAVLQWNQNSGGSGGGVFQRMYSPASALLWQVDDVANLVTAGNITVKAGGTISSSSGGILQLWTTSASDLHLGTGAAANWVITNSGGHFAPAADGTSNLGIASTNRIGNIYAAGDITTSGGDVEVAAGGEVRSATGGILKVWTTSASDLWLGTAGAANWAIANAGGHLVPAADGTSNIGAASTNRIHDIYMTGDIVGAGAIGCGSITSTGNLEVAANGIVRSATGGVLKIWTTSASDLWLGTSGAVKWMIAAAGHLLADGDGSFDIGAAATNRPRDLYLTGNVTFGGTLTGGVAGSSITGAIDIGSNTLDCGTITSVGNLEVAANGIVSATSGGVLKIWTQSASDLWLGTNGAVKWMIAAAGHLLPDGDGALDIGASTTNRVRNLYLTGNIVLGGTLTGSVSGGSITGAIDIGSSTLGCGTITSVGDLTVKANGTIAATTGGTLRMWTTGASDLWLGVNGAAKWMITGAAGHLLADGDGALDIGTASTNRPRHLYLNGNIVATGTLNVGAITSSGALGLGSNTITSGAITTSGNMLFNGTSLRITGDMSNSTVASRLSFQTSTTNSATILSVIPNGTAVISRILLHDNATPTNCSSLQLNIVGTASAELASIASTKQGTGTYRDLAILTGGSERARWDAASGKYSVTPTWNDAGTAFTAMLVNATNTASAAGSLLLDLQASSTSKFSVSKAGAVVTAGDITVPAGGALIAASGGTLNINCTSSDIYFNTNSTLRWMIWEGGGGHLLAGTDASYDIGTAASGFRPRDGYFSGTLSFGTRTAIGAETVTGYITITDSGGTSRKLAVVS